MVHKLWYVDFEEPGVYKVKAIKVYGEEWSIQFSRLTGWQSVPDDTLFPSYLEAIIAIEKYWLNKKRDIETTLKLIQEMKNEA